MLFLFTDGSVDNQSKIGFGVYTFSPKDDLDLDSIKSRIRVKQFSDTSSSKLELQTFLWAIKDIDAKDNKISVYTDSQNITNLLKRRERLEQNEYRNKKNKLLKNHDLYKQFYKIVDQIDCEFIKVKGHQTTDKRNYNDSIFSLVDKAAREALRKNTKNKK